MPFEKKPSRRRRGEGTLYFDETHQLWAWRGSITVAGKRSRPTVYGDTVEAVMDKVADLKATRGLHPRDPSKQTTGEYLAWWLSNSRADVRYNTRACYQKVITNHLSSPKYGIAHIPLVELSTFHILDARNAMSRAGAGGRTQQLASAVLHMALRDAVNARLIPNNPAAGLKGVKVHREEREPWSLEEARRFLAVVSTDPLGPLFEMALYTGMRQGELLGLHWDQIDVATGILKVTRSAVEDAGRHIEFGAPKSRRSRRALPYGAIPAARSALARQRERLLGMGLAACPLVFPTSEGTPILKGNLRRVFNRLITKAGVRRITFHDLRHTAGSLLLHLGVSIKVIQEILGHEDIKMTANTYVHASHAVKEDALGRIGAALAVTQ